MNLKAATCIAISLLTVTIPALAQDAGTLTPDKAARIQGKKQYSPYANRNFPTRPLFGDTHLHTAMSLDAGVFGANLMPRDAYRFARGAQVTSNSGLPVKLSRPLDFLVVTDHSDNMGFFPDMFAGAEHILSVPKGRE